MREWSVELRLLLLLSCKREEKLRICVLDKRRAELTAFYLRRAIIELDVLYRVYISTQGITLQKYAKNDTFLVYQAIP